MNIVKKYKLLVLPSWYPTDLDRINGSFFQEQSKLMTDAYDVRVLHIKFGERPSFRGGAKQLIEALLYLCKTPFARLKNVAMPAEEIFTNPPLTSYSLDVFGFTKRQRLEVRLNAYLIAINKMIDDGWIPDIVHAHSVNLAGLAARKIKEVRKIPYVITEHIPFTISGYSEYMRRDVQCAFKQADVVLSLGLDKVRQLGMSGIDVEPNLVYNFVDERVFDKLCDQYCPGNPLNIISIGAASHYKDHRTLLRALVVLKEMNIPFSLTLIGLRVWGDDALYNSTIAYIEDNNLQDHVSVLDKVEREQISVELSKNNIFVISSIAEGFPVSVLEAMATGLFVVSTRHGGTEDILTRESGVLVNIKDFNKIAEALRDIYMGNIVFVPSNIRKYIVSICGVQAFAKRMSGYYLKAIGAR